jgi:hypothetical protein
MLPRTGLRVLLSALAVAGAAPAAEAQVTSLEHLRVLLKPGDTVTVTDSAGGVTKGAVVAVSAASLELAVDGRLLSFPESKVRNVRQRRADSLRNGTLWGIAAGAGLGLFGDISWDFEYGLLFTTFYGGLGAAVGAGIDKALKSNEIVMFNPASSRGGLTLRPILARGRTGMAASLSF